MPDGEPIQRTHDAIRKYGVAFSPDGSQITYTAVGSVWTTMSVPLLGGEPRLLLQNAAGLRHSSGTLWQTELSTGKIERVVESVLITSYDVSPDGTRIVLAVKPEHGPAEIWLTSRGDADPPRRPTASGEDITPGPGEQARLTIAIPVPKGESMPVLPVAGVRSEEDVVTFPGVRLVDFALLGASFRDNDLVPGPVIGTFAYARTISHRNLFRVAAAVTSSGSARGPDTSAGRFACRRHRPNRRNFATVIGRRVIPAERSISTTEARP